MSLATIITQGRVIFVPKEFKLDVSDGLKLQAYTWEPENKETVKALVIIVHGIGEHANCYDEYARYFSFQGISVFSMDLRGHGRSPGKRGHTAPRANVLKDIDSLCEIARKTYPKKPLFIYGHSMGGNIGLSHRLYGGVRPRGYIITSPWITLYNRIPGIKILALRAASKIKPDFCIKNGIDSSGITSDKSQVVHGDPLAHSYISLQTALDCYDLAKKILETSHEEHGELLLLHSTDDTICSIEGSRDFMKHARASCSFIEWEGSRHELQHDKDRETVREVIRDWIVDRI